MEKDRGYIIIDWDGLKEELETKKPSLKFRKKISKSLLHIDPQRLKKLYEEVL